MRPAPRLAPALVLVALLVAPTLATGAGVDTGSGGAPGDGMRVLVALDHPLTPRERVDLATRGVVIEREYAVTPALLARVPAEGLGRVPDFVDRVRAVEPLEPHLNLATALTRANATAIAPLGVTGHGVTIAVVDSGVDATHPDLADRVLVNVKRVDGRFVEAPGDTSGHGTHVAGIAAGSGAASPDAALRGVAPGARVVGVDISSGFDTAAAMDAFDWLFLNKDAYDVRVVVNAWGRKASAGEAFDAADPLVRAADRLVREGVTVVFSASNHGPRPSTISLDAQNPRVLTVGATGDAGVVADYSSRGPVVTDGPVDAQWVKPDVVAPGTRVLAARAATAPADAPAIPLPLDLTENEDDGDDTVAASALRYRTLSGTSQAAPHVAGVVALMLEANPTLSPADVQNILRGTAIDLDTPGPDPRSGFGLVDARDAVLRALGRNADHGNVLIAGGTESFTARGRVTQVAGLTGVQTEPVPAVGQSGLVSVDVPVKPGATAVTFTLAWTPAETATFRAFFTNGEETLGPWSVTTREGERRLLRGQVPVDDLAPGTWRLIARGSATGDVAYEAAVHVTVRGDPARVSDGLDDEYRLPDTAYGPAAATFAWVKATLEEMGIRLRFAVREQAAWARAHPADAASLGFAAVAGVAGLVGIAAILRASRRGP